MPLLTLGSLFDGIGGWQLAAVRAGIKPLWSSEIDEFCCQITARHFPKTDQLGDINKLISPRYVDIITAGFPCTDLSVAGRRSGIHGKQSGLFFKAIEIVRNILPQFLVLENVQGLLSSNNGNDFHTLLEEILQEPIPLPRYWSNAGLVDGRKCQVAWRILDAQFFGVPQRRRRIFIIADFAGRRASQILFEPQSVSRDTTSREREKCDTANKIKQSVDKTGECFAAQRRYDQSWHLNHHIAPCMNTYRVDIVGCHHAIRRFTPTECERLQGLSDNWTQGISNTARYKALGNGMAQPCADWILSRLKEIAS